MYLFFNIAVPFAVITGLGFKVFNQKLRLCSRKKLFLTATIFAVSLFFDTVGFFIHASVLYSELILAALVFLSFHLVFHSSVAETAFVFFVLKSYVHAVFILGNILTESLPAVVSFLGEGVCFALICGLVQVLSLPIMSFFVNRYIRPLIEASGDMPSILCRYLWGVPFIFYLITTLKTFQRETFPDLDPTPVNAFVSIAWVIGVIAINLLVIRMAVEILRLTRDHAQLKLATCLVEREKDQYRRIKRDMDNTNHLRHDLRHHLVAVEGYLTNKNIEGALKYLREIMATTQKDENIILCDNCAVNAIVCHLFERAKHCGTTVSSTMLIPDALPNTESDLCVVIGNLVENAVEACESQRTGKRFVHVTASFTSKRDFCIMVENSFDHELRYDKTGHILSSKRVDGTSAESGIGLLSIESIVKKYNGTLRKEIETNTYKVMILLELTTDNQPSRHSDI